MKDELCNFKEMSRQMMRLMEFKWGEIDIVKALQDNLGNYSGKDRAFFNLLSNQYLEFRLSDLELGALKLEYGSKTMPFEGELLHHPIFEQEPKEIEGAYKSAIKKLTCFRNSSEYKIFVRATNKGITKEYADSEGIAILKEKWNGGHYCFDLGSLPYRVCQELDYAIANRLLYPETVSEKDMAELYGLMNYCQKTITLYLLMSNKKGNLQTIDDLPRIIRSIVPDFRIIRTQEYHSGLKTRYLTRLKGAH